MTGLPGKTSADFGHPKDSKLAVCFRVNDDADVELDWRSIFQTLTINAVRRYRDVALFRSLGNTPYYLEDRITNEVAHLHAEYR